MCRFFFLWFLAEMYLDISSLCKSYLFKRLTQKKIIYVLKWNALSLCNKLICTNVWLFSRFCEIIIFVYHKVVNKQRQLFSLYLIQCVRCAKKKRVIRWSMYSIVIINLLKKIYMVFVWLFAFLSFVWCRNYIFSTVVQNKKIEICSKISKSTRNKIIYIWKAQQKNKREMWWNIKHK